MPPCPAFKLRIFKSEYDEIKNLVLRFENIETGGDLFGLWTREAQPVIQLIIGPGEKCKRTSVSFHQDVNYLQNIGGYLNTSFMLCHIGSWHSHHQLSLTHPSAGDHTTVRNNFPAGLERYIMIIANIVSSQTRPPGSKDVELHPYMFSCEGQVCEDGVVELIDSPSPFRELPEVDDKIVTGAERTQNSNSPRRLTEKPRQQNQPSCRPGYGNKASRPGYGNKASNRNYKKSPSNATSEKPHGDPQQNSNDDRWYDSPEGGEKLKKIHEEILEMIKGEHPRANQSGKNKVKFSRDSKSHNLTLEFQHRGRQWEIQFPKSFGEEKSRVFYSSLPLKYSSRSELSFPYFSNNFIESIQRSCGCPSCELLMNLRNEVRGGHRAEVMEIDTEQSCGEVEPMSVCNDEELKPSSFPFVESGTINQESRTGEINGDTKEYQELVSITNSDDSNLDQRCVTAVDPDRTIDNQVRIREEDGDMAKRGNEEFTFVLPDRSPNKRPYYVKDETIDKEFRNREDSEELTKIGNLDLISTSYDADGEQYSSSECNETFQEHKRADDSENVVDVYNTHGVNRSNALQQRSLSETQHGGNISDSERRIQQWYESHQGEEKLKIIRDQIISNLKPTCRNHPSEQVEMTRDKESLDLRLSFCHNYNTWTIQFPRLYDEEDATIEYTTEDSKNELGHHATKDIVKAVQELCSCEDCGVEKEISSHYSQQGLDSSPTKTTRTCTEFKPSPPHNRDRENQLVSLNTSQVESKESEVSSSSSISPGKKTRKSRKKGPRRRKITFSEHANKSQNEKLWKNEGKPNIKFEQLSRSGGKGTKSTSFNTSPAESQELDISSSSTSSGGKMKNNRHKKKLSPYHCRNSIAKKTTKTYSNQSMNGNLLETSGRGRKHSWIPSHEIPIREQNFTQQRDCNSPITRTRDIERLPSKQTESYLVTPGSKFCLDESSTPYESKNISSPSNLSSSSSTKVCHDVHQESEPGSTDTMLNALQRNIKDISIQASGSEELKFKHDIYDWTILFHKTAEARLFKSLKRERSFCANIRPNNVVKILKDFCGCRSCIKKQTRSRKSPYSKIPTRKFSR